MDRVRNAPRLQPGKPLNFATRRILFVHVGKAGGTTLSDHLRVSGSAFANRIRRTKWNRQFEERVARFGESKLSELTIALMHCTQMYPMPDNLQSDRRKLTLLQKVTSHLLVLRDPVDRFVSWFSYVHPRNCDLDKPTSPSCQGLEAVHNHQLDDFRARLLRCFPINTNEFVMNLDFERTGVCPDIAKQAMALDHVNGTDVDHLFFNYRYYKSQMRRAGRREVLAVRTEHFWHDVKRLEGFLGGDDTDRVFENGTSHFHHAQLNQVNRTLTTKGTRLLCCYLADEIKIYIRLLNQAKNLNATEKKTTRDAILSKCGVNRWEQLMSIEGCHLH